MFVDMHSGDYETGLGETQLARYQRALNGGKAEFRNRNIAASAFVADTPDYGPVLGSDGRCTGNAPATAAAINPS